MRHSRQQGHAGSIIPVTPAVCLPVDDGNGDTAVLLCLLCVSLGVKLKEKMKHVTRTVVIALPAGSVVAAVLCTANIRVPIQ